MASEPSSSGPDARGGPARPTVVARDPSAQPARKAVQEDLSPQLAGVIADVKSKIHPRKVTGTFNNWRIMMVVFTQMLIYGLPWVQWNGRHDVLCYLATRTFYILGMEQWADDV